MHMALERFKLMKQLFSRTVIGWVQRNRGYSPRISEISEGIESSKLRPNIVWSCRITFHEYPRVIKCIPDTYSMPRVFRERSFSRSISYNSTPNANMSEVKSYLWLNVLRRSGGRFIQFLIISLFVPRLCHLRHWLLIYEDQERPESYPDFQLTDCREFSMSLFSGDPQPFIFYSECASILEYA